MEYVNLGHTGLKVSRLCLGCMTFGDTSWAKWLLNEAESAPIVEKAIAAGINFFDTADVYSFGKSEEIVGKLVVGKVPRDRLVIATKLNSPMSQDPNDRGLSRKHIMASIDSSLRRLGTDYVDLYQIHRFDPVTPLEESLEALSDLVRAGKVRYLGASSMYAWQLMKSLAIQRENGWAQYVSMQNHYNLLYREEEREMLPLCRSEGVGVIPWSPLARGLLAGNRKKVVGDTVRGQTDKQASVLYEASAEADAAVLDAVRRVAERHGKPMAVIAYAWVATRPGVAAPIVGISKLPQLDDALAALEVKLSAEDIAEMEAPYRPKPIAGH